MEGFHAKRPNLKAPKSKTALLMQNVLMLLRTVAKIITYVR
jgi:hypothetical protein